MNADDIRSIVIAEIRRIAPESDPAAVDPRDDIREVMDLDSMDVLNLVIALAGRLGVDIPELDYPHLLTLDGAVAYLAAKPPRSAAG